MPDDANRSTDRPTPADPPLRDAVFAWLFDLYGAHVDVRVADADELLAGPLIAWQETFRREYDRLWVHLGEMRTERDQARAALDRVRTLAGDLHTDARSMWAAAETHDSETDELVGDTYYEASKRLRRALDGPS